MLDFLRKEKAVTPKVKNQTVRTWKWRSLDERIAAATKKLERFIRQMELYPEGSPAHTKLKKAKERIEVRIAKLAGMREIPKEIKKVQSVKKPLQERIKVRGHVTVKREEWKKLQEKFEEMGRAYHTLENILESYEVQ